MDITGLVDTQGLNFSGQGEFGHIGKNMRSKYKDAMSALEPCPASDPLWNSRLEPYMSYFYQTLKPRP